MGSERQRCILFETTLNNQFRVRNLHVSGVITLRIGKFYTLRCERRKCGPA